MISSKHLIFIFYTLLILPIVSTSEPEATSEETYQPKPPGGKWAHFIKSDDPSLFELLNYPRFLDAKHEYWIPPYSTRFSLNQWQQRQYWPTTKSAPYWQEQVRQIEQTGAVESRPSQRPSVAAPPHQSQQQQASAGSYWNHQNYQWHPSTRFSPNQWYSRITTPSKPSPVNTPPPAPVPQQMRPNYPTSPVEAEAYRPAYQTYQQPQYQVQSTSQYQVQPTSQYQVQPTSQYQVQPTWQYTKKPQPWQLSTRFTPVPDKPSRQNVDEGLGDRNRNQAPDEFGDRYVTRNPIFNGWNYSTRFAPHFSSAGGHLMRNSHRQAQQMGSSWPFMQSAWSAPARQSPINNQYYSNYKLQQAPYRPMSPYQVSTYNRITTQTALPSNNPYYYQRITTTTSTASPFQADDGQTPMGTYRPHYTITPDNGLPFQDTVTPKTVFDVPSLSVIVNLPQKSNQFYNNPPRQPAVQEIDIDQLFTTISPYKVRSEKIEMMPSSNVGNEKTRITGEIVNESAGSPQMVAWHQEVTFKPLIGWPPNPNRPSTPAFGTTTTTGLKTTPVTPSATGFTLVIGGDVTQVPTTTTTQKTTSTTSTTTTTSTPVTIRTTTASTTSTTAIPASTTISVPARPTPPLFTMMTPGIPKTTTTTPTPTTTTSSNSASIECGKNTYMENPSGAIIAGTDSSSLTDENIVGGTAARTNEFPWQVRINYRNGFVCGGTVISARHVLTAAHCIITNTPSSYQLILGDHNRNLEDRGESVRNVQKITVHQNYSDVTNQFDLAIMEASSDIHFDNVSVRPVCLPRNSRNLDGQVATITGWGRLKEGGGISPVLQKATVPVLPQEECIKSYRTTKFTNDMLCAGSRGTVDTCQGDSGGPMVILSPTDKRYYIEGVTSWGYGCARPNYPGVYARVGYSLDWIVKAMA